MSMNNLPALVTRNLLISQGADCSWVWRYREVTCIDGVPVIEPPPDFADWEVVMEIRQFSGATPWITLDKNQGITLTSEGYVTASLPGDITQGWDSYRSGRYDILLISITGVRTRMSMGAVGMSPNISEFP